VGASDVGQEPGLFMWEEGFELLKRSKGNWKTLWEDHEPDDFGHGKETCVWLDQDTGNLCDRPCRENMFFICELAPRDQYCL